ncbi:WcbI family polysaccharide biosynthesis putative acetyltransferase [uncultured Methylobacterium sp.]|uniref:WcbI family polysaccharide biosynthesis putative acetyltransferase n=1 Tax=uncultured Methylobacterium sp. TaxID=157278 RepID=UPI0035CAD5C1
MFDIADLRRARYRLSQLAAFRRQPAGSPRILVIGVCQGAAIARAMRFLVPEAEVTFVSSFKAARRFPRMRDLLAEADRHDRVFSNIYLPPFRDGGTIEALRAHPRAMLIPTIVFSAFHPDLVNLGRQDASRLAQFVSGPMGHAHSGLALFGYHAGLAPAQVLRLFSEPVYRRLGYLDGWAASVAHLRSLGEQAGYDLDPLLVRWARRGCFMHANNHIKMHVAADLARGLLDRAGIAYGACDLDAYLPDDLGAFGSWPVYPEIGTFYGVPGSALFLKAATPRTGPARTMTLPVFIAKSYESYARRRPETLVCRTVDAWLADRDVSSFLRAAAGDALRPPATPGRISALPADPTKAGLRTAAG